MIPNTVTHMVESVVTPTDTEIIGRAGYVRLKNEKTDTTIITIYCPIEGQNIEGTEKLWYWVEECIIKLGNHSRIIIGTDANGHVGMGKYSERMRNTCGYKNAECTNQNGLKMIETMARNNMRIVNTFMSNTDGKTYFTQRNGEEKSTRVDYIIMADTDCQ